jgi:hypothetical protein
VDDRARVALSTCVGATVGGLVGFLLFTERGRRLREEIGAELGAFDEDLGRLQGAFGSLRGAAGNGWRAVSSFVSELARRSYEASDPSEERPPDQTLRFH